MMGSAGRIVARIAVTMVVSVTIGYLDYRINGGKPIRQLYKEVKNERLAREATQSRRGAIVLNREEYQVD